MAVVRRAGSLIAAMAATGLMAMQAQAQAQSQAQVSGDPAPGTTKQAQNPPAASPGPAPGGGDPVPDPVQDDAGPAESPVLLAPSGAPPTLTAIGFDHPGAHCRFLRAEGADSGDDAGQSKPEEQLTTYKTIHADPATLFFTERWFDGFGTFERGYARINGLLRELVLIERAKRTDGERRRYETLEKAPVSVFLEFTVSERTRMLTLLDGSVRVSRGGKTGEAVAVAGLCGPDAANRSAK